MRKYRIVELVSRDGTINYRVEAKEKWLFSFMCEWKQVDYKSVRGVFRDIHVAKMFVRDAINADEEERKSRLADEVVKRRIVG